MIEKGKLNIVFDFLMSLVLIFCLVRFSLVMVAGMSLFSLVNVIIAGSSAVAYFAITNKKYRTEFLGLNSFLLICCILMVVLASVLTSRSSYADTASNYYKQLIVLMLIWGLYIYLRNCNKKNAGFFITLYLVCVSISAVYTAYVALIGGEDIIRLTASGVFDGKFAFLYGGFDFIYALVLIYTAILTVLRNMWKQMGVIIRILLVILEILFAFTIIVSGYGTAFTLILVFTLWQLIPKGVGSLITIVVILVLVFVFPTVITNAISAIPFIPELTSSRLNELILSVSGQGSSAYITDDGQRMDRIVWSLKVFFENPIWGGFIGDTELSFGYHTEWIDQLARYGLITTIFNAAFWMFTYKKISKNSIMNDDRESYKCFKNTFIMFVILGFLDPISMVVTVCPLLVLSPFISKVIVKE